MFFNIINVVLYTVIQKLAVGPVTNLLYFFTLIDL